MAGATSSEPIPTAHDDAAMTCCHVIASGAAMSATSATMNADLFAPCGFHARIADTAPTLVAVALVTRHAAATESKHATGDDSPVTPSAATATHPASSGSQNACALRYPSSFTHLRA